MKNVQTGRMQSTHAKMKVLQSQPNMVQKNIITEVRNLKLEGLGVVDASSG